MLPQPPETEHTEMEERPRILIVDDERAAREMLAALLFQEGYDLEMAASGPEALERLEEFSADAILLDVMMPGMDGFQVCRRLRDDPLRGEIPVILVTALDDPDSRLRGIEAGADDFVSKPVDRIELRTRVRTITRLNRYRRLLWERTRRQAAEEETLRRNRELTLLNRVITAAASTLDIRQILHSAGQALADALNLPQVLVTLVNGESGRGESRSRAEAAGPFLTVACRRSESSAGKEPDGPESGILPLLPPQSIPMTPLLVGDIEDSAVLAHVRKEARQQGVRSMLCVPIVIRGQVSGSIELHAPAPHGFSDQDVTLAHSVATAVGQALENSQLYEELQRHARELEDTVARRTLELQAERDRTSAILEALGEAVIVTDVKGRILYANPAAVTLSGSESRASLLAQKWDLWQNRSLVPGFDAILEEIICSGQQWSGQALLARRDGTRYDAVLTVAPLYLPSEGGTAVGFVSVLRDITPIKEAERLKDQFISNVSHELRTPLSVITLVSGNLDALYERLDEEKRRQMIRDLRGHVSTLNEVIEDVLEISKIDSNEVSMERSSVDLMGLVREEMDKQQPLADRKGHHLCITGRDTLPVWGNQGQLRQVVRNLLNNAIKYTPDGGQVVCEGLIADLDAAQTALQTVDHPGSIPDRWSTLHVADSGVGIGVEDLEHVFERFYRVEGQAKIPGTGLGLAIARELVELHGGRLAVTSTPGKGSTFSVYLPLLEEELA